ncbi:FtsX-like permease family protein [Egibacter rhizosphaerae]|uniref:FtsX-like permease family protein n=1 Tax=Egibacter rhizosphaerae TaxID=1670831 RepID=A0A411YEM1_9ACTN|nr:FtsX-like permease family protein [Egibacter rhizosphaerae]QBI19659.1 FtsX-like permease family protein [Egibacter rhizosphaerae]
MSTAASGLAGRWARWRVALRLAARDARRHRGRTGLVVTLIAIPVALLAGGATLWATQDVSPAEETVQQFGAADFEVRARDGDVDLDWVPGELPDGAQATPLNRGELLLAGELGPVGAESIGVDLTASVHEGRLDLVAGSAPEGEEEVALTPALADDLDVDLGDVIADPDGDPVGEVVGLAEWPSALPRRTVFAAPDALPGATRQAGWVVTAGEAEHEAVATALAPTPGDEAPRGDQPGADAPEAGEEGTTDGGEAWRVTARADVVPVTGGGGLEAAFAVVAALALAEAALVAAAAFAVGVRRQLRDLGLLAAVGGRPGDLRRVMVAGGVVAGSVGAVLGAAGGIAAVALLEPWLESWLGQRLPGGLTVPVGLVALAVVGGLGAALAAAAAPARTAARLTATESLAGRLPPGAPPRRAATVGVALAALGVLLAGGAAWLARPAAGTLDQDPALVAIAVGAMLVVLGVPLASPAIAGALGRLAGRLPTLPRLALRDLARHRARTGAALAAVTAALALPVAIGTILVSEEPPRPSLAEEHVLLRPPLDGDGGVPAAAVDAAAESLEVESAASLAAVRDPDTGQPAMASFEGGGFSGRLAMAALDEPEEVAAVLGPDEAADDDALASAEDALAAGKIVLLGDDNGPRGRTVEIVVPLDPNAHADDQPGEDEGEPSFAVVAELPAVSVPGGDWPSLRANALITATAEAHDLAVDKAASTLIAAAEPPAAADRDAIRGHVATATEQVQVNPEGRLADSAMLRFGDTPTDPGRIVTRVVLVLAALVAGAVVAIATALAAAEGRGERATLAAVGASPRARRRLLAAQALSLALVAGALAIPVGLVPGSAAALGLIGRPPAPPWETLAVALIGLPLAAWAITRSIARERHLALRRPA